MADNQYLNMSAGDEGLHSPFSDGSDNGQELHSPFGGTSAQPTEQKAGVLKTIGTTIGARADAVAAALSQAADAMGNESKERSRYAMQRAERTNQEAQAQLAQQSGWGKAAVQAADIGTGLALNLIPEVGTAASAAYFGGTGFADQLRQQAQETGRYDVSKAAGVAAAQAALAPVIGGATGRALEYAAPAAARAVGNVAGRVLPAAGNAVGSTAEALAAPFGYLAGSRVGGAVGKVLGKGVGGTARAAGDFTGNVVIPQAAKGASQIITSNLGKAVAGGATTGGSLQMISNLANGKPLTEGVKEASEVGALAGGAIHAATPVVSTIAGRVPTTLSMAKENILGQRGRYEPQPEVAPEQPQPVPRATTAEEASIPTGETTQPSGAIPASEVGSIPGMENFNPEAYGKGAQGAFKYTQPGQGIGGGEGFELPSISNAGKLAGDKAVTLWNQFKKDGLAGLVSPKAVKQMSQAELTTESMGLKSGSELLQKARAAEGSADIMQQSLEEVPPDSPDFRAHVRANVNFALQSGSAAAHTRANQLAADVGMPTTSRFHDIELSEGLTNPEGRHNVATDIHGMTPSEIKAEHNAIKDSKGISIPFVADMSHEQIQKYQTYESHHNATREAYLSGVSRRDKMLRENRGITKDLLGEYREAEEPELFDQAQRLDRAMKEYGDIVKAKTLDVDHLRSVAQDITGYGTSLGVMDKFKNILGKDGTHNPVLDAEAWHNFAKRTRQVHPTAPEGQYKDVLENGSLGLEGVDFNKPASWIKPATKVVMQGVNRVNTSASLAKGEAMLRSTANSPERAVQEELQSGNTEGATAAASEALKSSGIETGDVTLGATPAEEIAATQQAAAPSPATPAQHAELGRRQHPAAGREGLTREQADLLIAHDNMRQNAAPQPDNQRVAEMAQGRPEETPAPVPEEVAPEAPVEEAPAPVEQAPATPYEGIRSPSRLPEPEQPAPAPEPVPEAPVEPSQPFEGQRAPSRLAEPQAAPEAPQEPTAAFEGIRKPARTLDEIAQEAPAEATVDVTKPVDEQTIKSMSDGEVYKNTDEASQMAGQGDRVAQENFRNLNEELDTRLQAPQEQPKPFEGVKRPSAPVKEEAPQEAPQAPYEGEKAPRKLAEPEREPAPVAEETKPTEVPKEPEAVAEKYSADEEIPIEATEFKEGETSAQRDNRVFQMIKKIAEKETKGAKSVPAKKPGALEARRKAEHLNRGIETARKQAIRLADEMGVERADIYTAIMNRPGGIKSLLENGNGEDAVKGTVRSAIKEFKSKQAQIAKGAVDEAGEIVRKRLGNIGSNREARIDRARADLLSKKGMNSKIIDEAISRAEAVTPNFTVEQMIGHARNIVRENAAKAAPQRKNIAVEDYPIVKSRKTLTDYVDSTGASGKTKRDLMKIVHEATEVGGGEVGSRQALTEAQLDDVVSRIHETLSEAAKTAQEAKKTSKSAIPSVQKRLQETAVEATQAASKAKQGEQKLRGDIDKLVENFKKSAEALKTEQAARIKSEEQLASVQQELRDLQNSYSQQAAEALAKAKDDLREEARTQSTDAIKEFGGIVSDELPTHAESPMDGDFLEWKAKVDVAAEELSKRGQTKHAEFLKGLSNIITKGLKNIEEMPDRRDLAMSGDDFNNLRKAYQDMKKGGNSNVLEATNVQWGTMGQNIRRMIFGHSGEWKKPLTNAQLKVARAKAKLKASDVGEGGIEAPGIK